MMTVEALQTLIHQQIAQSFRLPETERISITQAIGRVLAQDVVSPLRVPNANVSAMDGYALPSEAMADSVWTCVGESAAGRPFSGCVGQGECIRIMTGAVVPDDCQTVVMQENTQKNEQQIIVLKNISTGENIRYAGEEIEQNDKVLNTGRILREADILLLASLGFGEILVYRKIKVAVLSTGDELLEPSQSLTNNSQIYDSNRYMMMAKLAHLPIEIIDMKKVDDDLNSVMTALQTAAEQADVILTSGGVSVGDYDYLREAVSRLGQIHHYKVAMKPGKPFVFGQLAGAWYFGLGGNPLSGFVGLDMFVKTALWQLAGARDVPPPVRFQAVLLSPVKKAVGRMDIQRATISRQDDGLWTVKPCGSQDSHRILGVSQANAYMILPLEWGNLDVGDVVDVQPFTQAFL